MQSPRTNCHGQFYDMLSNTMLQAPPSQSLQSRLRKDYTLSPDISSPMRTSPLAGGSNNGSMFPIPPDKLEATLKHSVQGEAPIKMHYTYSVGECATSERASSNIVGPSDHYGLDQQQFQYKTIAGSNLMDQTKQGTKKDNDNNREHENPSNGINNHYNTLTVPPHSRSEPATSSRLQQQRNSEETKVCVIVDSKTPVLIKVPIAPSSITLADLKRALRSIDRPNYKYFFKSNDSEFGIVKEEIQDDDSHLPTYRNRVVAWIVTPTQGGDDLGSRFRSDTSDTCNLTYSNTLTSYDDGSSSIFTTDLESTSYFTETDEESQSCSNYSETTCDTFVSRRRNTRYKPNNSRLPVQEEYIKSNMASTYNQASNNHNNNQRLHRKTDGQDQHDGGRNMENVSTNSSMSTATSSSLSSSRSSHAYSEATAVNHVTVHLVLTNENFLGLHITTDDGIFVDDIAENSALALDGRIGRGDKLIQVNERNLEELSNEEAINVLKEAVLRRGPLKLVVAKTEDECGNDIVTSLKDTIHPINTSAWVEHTLKMTTNQSEQNNSTTSSPSFDSNAQDTDCIRPIPSTLGRMGLGLRLSKDSNDMKDIVMHMRMPSVGLDIRDRRWLKIHIADAFLGSDLIKWLERNVHGFLNECDARKYAARMLEEGIIQDPLSKNQFSPKSFYTLVT